MTDFSSIYHASNLLHTEEKFVKYRRGGYHPVRLGESYKSGRYVICHKLGHGGFSTVWLAKDTVEQRWVSIKFMIADISPKNKKGHAELDNLRSLSAQPTQHPGSEAIVKLLDYFAHEGPNGKHLCLVLELLGPSIHEVICRYSKAKQKLSSKTILKISKQLLYAIDYMHSAGYAHGDLSPKNLHFTSTGLSHLPEEKLFSFLGSPRPEKLERVDNQKLDKGVPVQLLKAADWRGWARENKEDLRIIDLGECFPIGAKSVELAWVPDLRPPEDIFQVGID